MRGLLTWIIFVLVAGGLPRGCKDLPAAREMVADGIAELAPYAAEYGIRLAVEPLHPMFCADRAVVSTLGQGLDMVDRIGAPNVGVCIDTYHIWWDPEVYPQIARAGERIYVFQVCDFLVPIPSDARAFLESLPPAKPIIATPAQTPGAQRDLRVVSGKRYPPTGAVVDTAAHTDRTRDFGVQHVSPP